MHAVNLLPWRETQQQRQHRYYGWLCLVFSSFVLSIVLSFGYYGWSKLNTLNQENQRQQKNIQHIKNQLSTQGIKSQSADVRQQYEQQCATIKLLQQFPQLLGHYIYFQELNYKSAMFVIQLMDKKNEVEFLADQLKQSSAVSNFMYRQIKSTSHEEQINIEFSIKNGVYCDDKN